MEINTLWIKEGEETIGRSVVTMINFRRLDGRLIVATHGNGTFLTYLTDAKPKEDIPAFGFGITTNYPNPFDDETLIKYDLPSDGIARIDIFDSTRTSGQKPDMGAALYWS